MNGYLSLGFIALLAGCSHGFDRGALRKRLAGERTVVTDQEIREALARKPQITLPFSLAIEVQNDLGLRWDVKDKEKIVAALEPLEKKGIISNVFVMLSDPAQSLDPRDAWKYGREPEREQYRRYNWLRSVRLKAARHGADAVLVVRGAAQVDSHLNPLCLANLLILPGWILPASHRDALVIAQGTMWDVRNEFIYLSSEADGEGATVAPSFLIEEKVAIRRAQEKALEGLLPDLARRLESLRGSSSISTEWTDRGKIFAPSPVAAREEGIHEIHDEAKVLVLGR